MYRLIATDLDGTLLDPDRNISKANAESIKKAMSRGMHFVIATGRPIEGILHIAGQLDLVRPGQYAIGFNGAVVYELNPLRQICSCSITGAQVKEMAIMAEKLKVNYHAFSTTRGLLASKPNQWTDVEMTLNKIGCTWIDFSTIPDDEEFQKFMFCGSAEEVQAFGDELNDISMIEYAGLGVAMANAVPEVKKAADLITESNTEDGLAKVLDRIIADQS